MVITDYRVQSVLRTYSKQLQRSKLARKLDMEDPGASREKVTISEEARRKVIMDQVTSQALEQAYPRQGEDDPIDMSRG
jgi:hypothetical protein